MFQLLYKYFILNQSVSLPGIGTFSFARKPAAFDFNNKLFMPPQSDVVFRGGGGIPSQRFYSFVAAEKNLEEAEAIREFEQFSSQLKQDLSAREKVELPGIGVLFQSLKGELRFQSFSQANDYFPLVNAERLPLSTTAASPLNEVVVADDEPHTIAIEEEEMVATKRSYWWIYALLLALIALAAIAYYYWQNGSFQ